jgi:Silicon transporter
METSTNNDAQEITYEESMLQHYYCAEYAGSKDSTDIEGCSTSSFGADESTIDEDKLIRLPSAVFQVPDESGQLMCYNKDNCDGMQQEEAATEAPFQKQKQSKKKNKSTQRTCVQLSVDAVKYFCSMALLGVSVAVVMAAIFTKQTKIARDVSPWLAFSILWGLIFWLAVMEGGQNCLVGLQPIDKKLYADSHLVATLCTNLAHKGDNMRRFIIGRQFFVVLVVFMINLCGSPIGDVPTVSGFLSPLLSEIFLSSGLALIMLTTTLGQLTAQINASIAMLDFINNYFMLLTTYVSLAIEWSGLLHAVYLVQFQNRRHSH